MKKKICSLLLLVFLIALTTPLGCKAINASGKKNPMLDQTRVYLVKGKTLKLKVKNKKGKVKWSSSRPGIAKVSKTGKVKGLKAGKAVILARTKGKTLKCSVVVMELSEKSITLKQKASRTIKVLKGKNVQWTSSRPDVATVVNGQITAVNPGKTVITAESQGRKMKCTVRVPLVDTSPKNMAVSGSQSKLTLTARHFKKKPTFESSDTSVASVSKKGVVTAKKAGNATITITGDKLVFKRKIKVMDISEKSTSVVLGFSKKLSLDNAGSNVIWSSSNDLVAKVDGGNIVSVNGGNCTITATIDDLSLACKVKVISTPRIRFLAYLDLYNSYIKANGKYFKRQYDISVNKFSKARKKVEAKQVVGITCVVPIRWALREIGIKRGDGSHLINAYEGTFSKYNCYSGDVVNHFKLITSGGAVGKSFKDAVDKKLLVAGDIITFKGRTHTFVYSGVGYKCYDGGQAAEIKGYSKVGITVDYTTVGSYKKVPISEILRWK